jgi:DNA (cytosine-5)-methyltransferase 1
MANYYNEFDPYAAQWLRNLIKAGHIPDGEVDTRSIVDVRPDDLRGFTQCHFFAGIAGFSHALRLAGFSEEREIWSGSCPCQPFSVAGKGKGEADERHLWPHFFRLISACRPAIVIGEQVSGQAGYGWLDGVRSDLESQDYSCEAFDIPACAVNAPHIRQRLYWVARRTVDDTLRGRHGNANQEIFPGRDSSINAGRVFDLGHADNAGSQGHWEPVEQYGSEGRQEQNGCIAETGVGHDMADAESLGRRQGAEVIDGVQSGNSAEGTFGRLAINGSSFWDDMADADSSRCRGRPEAPQWGEEQRTSSERFGPWHDAEWVVGADGKTRRIVPGVRLLVAGLPGGGVAFVRTTPEGTEETNIYSRAAALKCFGNAIVPPLAAEVIKAFMDTKQ